MESLFALRLADLQIFTALARDRSIARVALAFDLGAPAIRVALTRLEEQLGATLFMGGEDTLDLTGTGRRLHPLVQGVVEGARSLELEGGAPALRREWLTIAAPSFIGELLFPHLASGPELRSIRGLSVPQMMMPKFAEEHLFDATLSIATELTMPMGWSSLHVGDIRYALFASPAMAGVLGADPQVEDIRRCRFVAPVYVSPATGELVPGDDRCPLPRGERRIAHEVENIRLACRLAIETDHLVYGPALAAAPFVSAGVLAEIRAPGFARVDPLYLACDTSAVRARVQDALFAAIRCVLGASRPSGIVPSVPAALMTAAERADVASSV
jgi:DNA-binding transcriptional LysR family regulator